MLQYKHMGVMLRLSSSAFEDCGIIPAKYTCDGSATISPPLTISGVPDGTKSLVLVMDDPDIPQVAKDARGIDSFDHWVLYNIPPETRELPESDSGNVGVGELGLNGSGSVGYASPCPPPHHEPKEHCYIFALYALRDTLSFKETPSKEQVLQAMESLLIAGVTLIGRYSRA